MDPAEAQRLVDSWATNAIKAANVTGGPPASSAGVNPAMMTGAKPTFVDRNMKGVPLDVEQGVPLDVRFKVALNSDDASKLQYLEGLYGKGNVRFADTGEPIVRVADPASGGNKDVLVNERGFSLGDIAEAATYLPEVAGSLAAMLIAKRVPGIAGKTGWGARGADIVAGTIGQEAGTVAKEAVGTSKPLGQSLAEAKGRVPIDLTLNAAAEAGVAAAARLSSPLLGERPPVATEGKTAQTFFKETMGEEYPMTAGQATGNQLLSRVEATMGKLPGSSSQYEDIRSKQSAKLSDIMRKILGLPENAAVPGAEEVGERAIAAIDQELSPLKRAVTAAQDATVAAANNAVGDVLASAVGSAKQLYPERVGASIRTKAIQLRDQFKGEAERLYNEAYALPGGTDRSLAAPSLPGKAAELLKQQPTKDVVKEVSTGLVDETGHEMTRTIKGKVPMREFIPPKVLKYLRTLAGLEPEQQFSLKDLVAMRSDVYNSIAEATAVPGVETHFLDKIRDTLTGAIEEATSAIPDKNLQNAWKAANDYYRQNVGKFQEGTIARLFKDVESRGFVQNEDIVRNIGPTEYATFKKFLGENTPEFQGLKRAIVDNIFSSPPVTEPGTSLINGNALVDQLAQFYKKNRAVAEDILGPAGSRLQTLGELLSGVGTKVDAEEMRSLLTQQVAKGQTASIVSSVRELIAHQDALDKVYKSAIVRDIGEGRIGKSFNAAEFVSRLYNSTSPAELQQITQSLGRVDPDALTQVRQKIIERIFSESQRAIRVTDPSGIGKPALFRAPSSVRLEEILGKEDQAKGLRTLLGPDTYNNLVQLSKLVRPSELSESTFKAAGGISAGMQITGMVREGVFSYLPDFIKQKIAAILLTRPALTKYISGQLAGQPYVTPENRLMVGKAVVASMPFIKAIVDDYGEEAAPEVLNTIQRGVRMFEAARTNAPTASPEKVRSANQELDRLLAKPANQ